MSDVINMRTAPEGWKSNPKYVYIGRGSAFGNPYKVGAKCPRCGQLHKDGGSTLPCFSDYFEGKLKDREFAKKCIALYGKTLVCFCKPKPCHGDIISAWVNKTVAACLERLK